jgi:hypothetical protein
VREPRLPGVVFRARFSRGRPARCWWSVFHSRWWVSATASWLPWGTVGAVVVVAADGGRRRSSGVIGRDASPELRKIGRSLGTAGKLADEGERVLPGTGSVPIPALGSGGRGERRGRVLGRAGAAGAGTAGHVETGSRSGRTSTVWAIGDDRVGRRVGAPRAVAQSLRREMTSVCMVSPVVSNLVLRP